MTFSPCVRIKSKSPSAVMIFLMIFLMTSCATALFMLQAASSAFGDETSEATPPPPPESTEPSVSPSAAPTDLPKITAKSFQLKSIKTSASGRIYLFSDVEDQKTATGRILLLRKDQDFVAGLRVLKRYSDRKEFAARVVKTYPGFEKIPMDTEFGAVEKLGDIAMPKLTRAQQLKQDREDNADLKEIEKGFDAPAATPDTTVETPPDASDAGLPAVQESLQADPSIPAYDPELDSVSGLKSKKNSEGDSDDPDEEEIDDEDEDSNPLEVEEIVPFDHNKHNFSTSIGIIRSASESGSIAPFKSVAFRYGIRLGKMIYQQSNQLQDEIHLEAGLFLYQLLNAQTNASYTVVPVGGTLRYTLNFANRFGFFFYGGVIRGFVATQSNGSAAGLANIQQFVPAGGVGMLINVGPSWDSRIDLGIDSISLGLMLRF